MRFRSKPSEIEAVQWTGDNDREVKRFCGPNVVRTDPLKHKFYGAFIPEGKLLAGKDGAQGWVPVPIGHWIVRTPGDTSDVWPVDPDYFAAKYEPIPAGGGE